MKERRIRSIIKTVSWRVIATCATMIIAYVLTSELTLALSIGLLEFFSKLFLYYIHERIWVGMTFGLIPEGTDYQI